RARSVAGNEPELPAVSQGVPRRGAHDRAVRGARDHALPAARRRHPGGILPHLPAATGDRLALVAPALFLRGATPICAHPRARPVRAARSGLELRRMLRAGTADASRKSLLAVGAAVVVRRALARALGDAGGARRAAAARGPAAAARRGPERRRRSVVRSRRGTESGAALPRAGTARENAAAAHQPPEARAGASPARTGRGRTSARLREPLDAALRPVVPRRKRAQRGAGGERGPGPRLLRTQQRARPARRGAKHAPRG